MARYGKEQRKRIGSVGLRNKQFRYMIGMDSVEKFVATPELLSEDQTGADPLPAEQIWTISPVVRMKASACSGSR